MSALDKEKAQALYDALRLKAIEEGIRDDVQGLDRQEMMDKHFCGVSFATVRALVEEHYPEEFI